mgnify:CR=1 FL=1
MMLTLIPPRLVHGLAALAVADVPGRRAEEARDGVLLLVLAHVDADHVPGCVRVAAKELGGDCARELCLSDAGGSEEEEGRDWLVSSAESRARAHDCVRDGCDRRALSDDARGELAQPAAVQAHLRDVAPVPEARQPGAAVRGAQRHHRDDRAAAVLREERADRQPAHAVGDHGDPLGAGPGAQALDGGLDERDVVVDRAEYRFEVDRIDGMPARGQPAPHDVEVDPAADVTHVRRRLHRRPAQVDPASPRLEGDALLLPGRAGPAPAAPPPPRRGCGSGTRAACGSATRPTADEPCALETGSVARNAPVNPA